MSDDNITVFDLINKTKNTDLLTFEATVTTGFENVAYDEFQERFPGNSVCRARGRIYFNLPNNTDYFDQVLCLRSIDNIFIIASECEDIHFKDDYDSDIKLINNFAESYDFTKSLLFWKSVTHFSGIIFPSREEHDSVKDVLKSKKLESKESNVRFNSNELNFKFLRFRVTCHRSQKHSFTSNEAAKAYGGIMNNKHNWIVDLDTFDLEIVLNIVSNNVLTTFKLTTQSQHKRNIVNFGRTTLRPTVCYSLIRLAKPQPGEILLDPMCGTGSITVESVLAFKNCFNLCGDIDENDLITKCTGNVQNLQIENIATKNTNMGQESTNLVTPDLFVWDVTKLPFRDNVIDIVVSDLPFGKRVGNKVDNRVLYRKLLLELARVTLVKTGRAVLLTYDRRSMSSALKLTGTYWHCAHTSCVNIGGLGAAVYVLNRRKFCYNNKLNDFEDLDKLHI